MRRPLPDHLRVPWTIFDALVVFILGWVGVPIVIVLTARSLAPNFVAASWLITGIRSGDVVASFALALMTAMAGLALVGLYLRKYHATLATAGWRKFKLGQSVLFIIAVYVGFIVLVGVAFYIATQFLPGFNADQAQVNEFTGKGMARHYNLSLIALVVLPPIIEETIFRGFIFPAFSKRFGAVIGAIATSMLFGIAHLQANISLYTFILSLLLCYMYYRLKSIFPGMALHMINNFIAFTAMSGGLK